jgi:DNA invertase Pin-like site-specific DNA recombinase
VPEKLLPPAQVYCKNIVILLCAKRASRKRPHKKHLGGIFFMKITTQVQGLVGANASSINSGNAADVINAAIYCRTARLDSTSGTSIACQVAKVSDHISCMGCSLVDIYQDIGFSGNDENRPALNRLRRDIELGRVNCVAVTDMERLSRDAIRLCRWLDFFEQHGVQLVSLDGNDADSFTISLVRTMRETYSQLISNKVKQVRHEGALQGKYMSPQAPYGYMKDNYNKHRLVVDTPVASIVWRIFMEYSIGESARTIADRLNAEGIYSPSVHRSSITSNVTGSWSASTILLLLRNQAYIGNIVSGKRETVSVKTGKRRTMSPNEWIIVENVHEPIISKPLWDMVQERLSDTKRGSRQ